MRPILNISVCSLTHLCVLGVVGRQFFSWFTDLQTGWSYTQGTEPKESQPSWDLIMDLKPDATIGTMFEGSRKRGGSISYM